MSEGANLGRRSSSQAGGIITAILILVAVAMLASAGLLILARETSETYRCQTEVVQAIGASASLPPGCGDPRSKLRESSIAPPIEPRRGGGARPIARVTLASWSPATRAQRGDGSSASVSSWGSRFAQAGRDGFVGAGSFYLDLAARAASFATSPARWGEAVTGLDNYFTRSAEAYRNDPLGAFGRGTLQNAQLAKNLWMGVGQLMYDTGADLFSGDPERMGTMVGARGFDALGIVAAGGAGSYLRGFALAARKSKRRAHGATPLDTALHFALGGKLIEKYWINGGSFWSRRGLGIRFMRSRSTEDLRLYILGTRSLEAIHHTMGASTAAVTGMAIASGDLVTGGMLIGGNLAANVAPIVSLRYNRHRAMRVLEQRKARQAAVGERPSLREADGP